MNPPFWCPSIRSNISAISSFFNNNYNFLIYYILMTFCYDCLVFIEIFQMLLGASHSNRTKMLFVPFSVVLGRRCFYYCSVSFYFGRHNNNKTKFFLSILFFVSIHLLLGDLAKSHTHGKNNDGNSVTTTPKTKQKSKKHRIEHTAYTRWELFTDTTICDIVYTKLYDENNCQLNGRRRWYTIHTLSLARTHDRPIE